MKKEEGEKGNKEGMKDGKGRKGGWREGRER